MPPAFEIYSKREFMHAIPIEDQIFTIVDKQQQVLYYYIVKFDEHDCQTMVYKTFAKDQTPEKLLGKKLIILNNVSGKHTPQVKLVDKSYKANPELDEFDVMG